MFELVDTETTLLVLLLNVTVAVLPLTVADAVPGASVPRKFIVTRLIVLAVPVRA
jgi:hypothetical protein